MKSQDYDLEVMSRAIVYLESIRNAASIREPGITASPHAIRWTPLNSSFTQRRGGRSFATCDPSPVFIKEPGRDDPARPSSVWWSRCVDNRPIRQFRHFTSIGEIVGFTPREPTVENHVSLRVERVRINQDGNVGCHWVALCAHSEVAAIPLDRQLGKDPGQQSIA